MSVLFEMLFYGAMEKDLRSNLIQHSLENINRVSPYDESWKINPIIADPHLSCSDGSYIEALCLGIFLGRGEWKEEQSNLHLIGQ